MEYCTRGREGNYPIREPSRNSRGGDFISPARTACQEISREQPRFVTSPKIAYSRAAYTVVQCPLLYVIHGVQHCTKRTTVFHHFVKGQQAHKQDRSTRTNWSGGIYTAGRYSSRHFSRARGLGLFFDIIGEATRVNKQVDHQCNRCALSAASQLCC